jgi:phage-related protein
MRASWEIEFYSTETGSEPVLDFIRSLPKVERSQVGRIIRKLEEEGTALRMPQSRPLVSAESLFELRVSGEQNIYRVLYFHFTGRTFVLVHAFTKKTQRTPEKEIKIALQRLRDHKKRKKEGEGNGKAL